MYNPSKERAIRIQLRAINHQKLIKRGVIQGYLSKAKSILEGKGKNGRSMSPALLLKHGIKAKEVTP